MINTEIKLIRKKINDLLPYENNPRHNDEAVDPVSESIVKYGYKVPIIIDSEGTIVTGHTRLKALQKLGIKEVDVILADDLTDEQVKEFRLVDNKVSEFAKWDDSKLQKELIDLENSLKEFGFDLSFDNEDIEKERIDKSDSLNDENLLIIELDNEIELETLFNEMTERGFKCRISTL